MLFAGTAFALFGTIRQELTPTEDRSVVLLRINAPQGVSLDYTTQQMRRIEELIQPLRDSGEIESTFENAGQSGSYNSGFMVMTLAPWDERERSQQEIIAEISRLARQVPSVRVFPMQPNSLGIRGAGNGLQFALCRQRPQGAWRRRAARSSTRCRRTRASSSRACPSTRRSRSSPSRSTANAPPISASTSPGSPTPCRRCSTATTSATSIIADRSYGVKLVSTTNPINDPTDLENIFLKTADGRYVPMSTIATLTERAVPPSLTREQQQPLGGDHLQPRATTSRLATRCRRAEADRRRRCCRRAAASCRWPRRRRSAKPTAA